MSQQAKFDYVVKRSNFKRAVNFEQLHSQENVEFVKQLSFF